MPSPQALSMGGCRASARMTLKPFCRAAIAAASPTGPPPITKTSVFGIVSIAVLFRLRSLSRMAIKAVIFDLGRVIVPFDFSRGYAKLEPLCGIPAAEIPKRIGPTGLVTLYESGGIESRDFVRELSKQLNLDIGYEGFCEIWNCIFGPDTLIPEAMLQGIARKYRMVLLSNTSAIHFEMVRKNYPLLRHFHAFVLSHEVG